MKVPSVIRLLEYRRIPHQTRALSRKNILMRDRYTCQYCLRTPPGVELTLDHVIPRSRAGETTWENLVACCHSCNNRKGNRTPEEAGMKLARAPRPFSLHTSRHLMRLLGKSDDQWRKYLVTTVLQICAIDARSEAAGQRRAFRRLLGRGLASFGSLLCPS